MITSLPYDIMHQIVSDLDFPSIFALRLTCKAFNSFTKVRQIWYGFIRDLRTEHGVCPEGELGTYTLEELERWVVPRQRARDVWGGERGLRFRSRVATLPSSALDMCEFLPGGRWLLFSGLRNLYALDLDPGVRALQPETLMARIQGIVKYSRPWVDRSSDRLTVRIAAWVQSHSGLQIFVQEIKMVGHGVDATLAARHCARFRLGVRALSEHEQVRYATTAVNDRYYVVIREGQGHEVHAYHYSEGLDQEKPLNLSPAATLRFESVGHETTLLYVQHVHGDIFIFHSKDNLHIFEIVRQETSSCANISIQLLQTIPFMDFQFRSSLRWSPGASKIVFLNQRHSKGVHIPHDRSILSTLTDLGRHARKATTVPTLLNLVGVTTSLFSCGLGYPMEIYTHRWSGSSISERDDPTHRSAEAEVELLCAPEGFAYDEDIGRMVLCRGSRVESRLMLTLLVFDLV